MKVAIAHWQGRVSPVFDVAGNVLLVDVADGRENARENVDVGASLPQARANLLASRGADVLICGAISKPLEAALATAGIEVISQTWGEVERVLAASITGQWSREAFLMPGCRVRRRRGGGGRGLAGPDGGRGGRCRRRGRNRGGQNGPGVQQD